MEPTEACVDDVAAYLGREASPEAQQQFAAMRRLVAVARKHGNDCGLALLAGVWLAEGKPEHEIVARCWPKHRRLAAVDGPM